MLRILLFLIAFVTLSLPVLHAQKIRIETGKTSLVFDVKKNKRLCQAYFGEKLIDTADYNGLPNSQHEAYITGGMEDLFEPAIRLQHADGTSSLELLYESFDVDQKDANTTLTTIHLKDPQYPVTVDLKYLAYNK